MAEAPTIHWHGKSGQQYRYRIYVIGTEFLEQPGNYIFAKETGRNSWIPCYIGQSENLNQRLGDHGKEVCARRNGATHIHVHLTLGGEALRKAEEADLIQNWRPPCNEQLA